MVRQRPALKPSRFGLVALALLAAMGALSLQGATAPIALAAGDASGSISSGTRAADAPETSPVSALSRSAEMTEGGRHSGPRGWRELCASEPAVCAPPTRRRPGAITRLDAEGYAQLERFNTRMNAALTPANDKDAYAVEDLWRVPAPGDPADCEDYVLAKRQRLLAAGWPAESVLIGVVRGDVSPYHAVLVLRTDRGELVLDNLTDEIRDWRESGYSWVVRQSAQAPERWVRVIDATG